MTPPDILSDILSIKDAPQVRPDCKHYRGLKPCGRAEDCDGCSDFTPIGPRVLIIKLGALGDVLRTTPLLTGLKEQIPGVEIVWLTSPASSELLENNPLIDSLWLTGAEALARLQVEEFDRVICLDKEPEAIACASLAKAPAKYGFGMSDKGRLAAFNRAAVENLRLGISDELKFRVNEKTYQRLIFEAAELEYKPEYDYVFNLNRADLDWAAEFMAERLDPQAKVVIGFNLGGGNVFAAKRWKIDHFLALRRMIDDRWGRMAAVLAFAGQDEAERLARLLAAPGPPIIDTGTGNPMGRFAALLGRCDVLVTGDSLGMHLALAMKSKVVLLIGSTTHREIELYGRGEMIVSEMECSPCYRRLCPKPKDCMENFTPELVMDRLAALIDADARS